MFNINGWNWAIWAIVVFSFVSLVVEARKNWTSFGVQLISTIIAFVLLYFGGFFRGF